MFLPMLRSRLSIVAIVAALPLAACFDPTEVEDTETEGSTAGDATTSADSSPATSGTPSTTSTTDVATSSTGPGPDPATDSGATTDTTGGVVDSSSGTSTGGDVGDSSSTGSDEDSTTGPVVPPGMCNEMLGAPCAADQWCDYPDDLCGAGAHGMCFPQPRVCNLIFAPHCGCDGVTHSNECVANANGTDIDHPGDC